MNDELYDQMGYVPASPVENENSGEICSDIPGSSDIFEDSQPSIYEPTPLPPVTPPKKSILRPTGYMTPNVGRKSVKFSRKSKSWNITPACSPAYEDRSSISESDMANNTFCLERLDLSSKSDLQAVGVGQPNSPRPSSSGAENRGASGSSVAEGKTFRLSSYITMIELSSPMKKSFSNSYINRIGLHSTPTASVDLQSNLGTPIRH